MSDVTFRRYITTIGRDKVRGKELLHNIARSEIDLETRWGQCCDIVISFIPFIAYICRYYDHSGSRDFFRSIEFRL